MVVESDISMIFVSIVIVSILFNLVAGLIISLALYKDAPERDGVGFIKYWQAMMMDAAPGSDKSLLIFDNDPERKRIFGWYRVISLSSMIIVGLSVVLHVLLK